MKKLSRRSFLRTSFASFAGLTLVRPDTFELTLLLKSW